MRSRKYNIKLRKANKTIRIIVYADRSVEMGIVDHDNGDRFYPRYPYAQTRKEAAWSISFARLSDTGVKREYI